jgi:hypothetical protein
MLPLFFIFFLFSSHSFAHEKNLRTNSDSLAFGKFEITRSHPWPFPVLSIGHNMQSFQNYSNDPYWHDGLDIRSREDQPIYSSTVGKVVNIENYVLGNPYYWEVAILDDDGLVWKYHHVDKRSLPDEIKQAYKTGNKIKAGTYLGDVVRWGVTTYGEVYHHLHLLVVASGGQYINPLLLLSPLDDTEPPKIKKVGLTKNHKIVEGTKISGPHGLYVDCSDLILHDKFIVPPHKISFNLDNGPEVVVWEFINLPSNKNDTDFINDFFVGGTCGNYDCRKILINLLFTKEKPRQEIQFSKGDHQIQVNLEDLSGNKSSSIYHWQVI